MGTGFSERMRLFHYILSFGFYKAGPLLMNPHFSQNVQLNMLNQKKSNHHHLRENAIRFHKFFAVVCHFHNIQGSSGEIHKK